MNVLVITKSDDHEGVQCTLDAIANTGATAIRFDTDRFPTEVGLDLQYGGGRERIILRNHEVEFDLGDVDAVYYRRVDHARRLPLDMDAQLRKVSTQESRVTIEGMITALPGFHLDPLWRVRMMSNKALQLRVAQQIGLEVPRTLITNEPAAVRAFASSCPNGMVTKMQASFAIYEDNQEKVVFTTPVESESLGDLEGLRLCPMTFQEKIDKQLELRITVVGTKLFASAVDSKQNAHTEIDWRRDGSGLLNAWQPLELPQELHRKLLRFMDIMGLQYGAIDVLHTPDNRYVFLEVNPVGEYFWLDQQHDARISDTLAEVLLGNHRRQKTAETLGL